MENKQNIILRISLILNSTGFHWAENEWNCEEKKSIFKLTKPDGNKTIERRLKKEEIFSVYSIFTSGSNLVQYGIMTFPDKKEEAKKLLMERVIKTAKKFKEEIDLLVAHIPTEK